jgi:hypothetical protein
LIPDHTKDILDTVIPDILKKAIFIIDVNKMVLDYFVEVLAWIMSLKLLPRRYRKIDIPWDIRGIFPLQCHLHYISFIQLFAPVKEEKIMG